MSSKKLFYWIWDLPCPMWLTPSTRTFAVYWFISEGSGRSDTVYVALFTNSFKIITAFFGWRILLNRRFRRRWRSFLEIFPVFPVFKNESTYCSLKIFFNLINSDSKQFVSVESLHSAITFIEGGFKFAQWFVIMRLHFWIVYKQPYKHWKMSF